MTLEELKQIDTRYRQEKPKLFELSSDKPASERQLDEVERAIGVRLPASYCAFLSEFGGGTYGFAVIFSADPDGEWYLPNEERKSRRYLPEGLLPFSDDFAGGSYVFKIVDGVAQEAVFYWNTDGGESPTEFKDIMEFVARKAYEP